MKVGGCGVGYGILGVYSWEKEEISMDVFKGKGKMECKGKILKNLQEKKEIPNTPLDVFLYVICDSRSQGLKMLLRMAYG